MLQNHFFMLCPSAARRAFSNDVTDFCLRLTSAEIWKIEEIGLLSRDIA